MSQTGKAVEYLCLACGSQGLVTVPNQTCEAYQPQTPCCPRCGKSLTTFRFHWEAKLAGVGA